MKSRKSEQGYVLVGVLFLIALAMIISGGMLDSAASNTKTRAIVKTQATYYYQVEETLNRVVGWLQTNSKSLVTAFNKDNFDDNFTLGAPSFGDNEGEHFEVATMVKMDGTNDSVMLSNNAFFGTPAFPNTTHIDTGAAFNAVTSFQNADLGEANARIVLIWARDTADNYEPIFRIDVVTGNNPDRGVHSFSYVYSTLVAGGGDMGFYGKNSLTFQSPNNDCFSYLFTHNGANWNLGAPRANCPIGSDGAINISSDINGTAKSLLGAPSVNLNPPGGNVSGGVCEGGGCHSYTLPAFLTWDAYCPGVTTDLAIAVDTPLPAGGCYRNVSIDNKKYLTLSDTTQPYYFKFVDFKTNFAHLAYADVPVGEKITVYIEQVNNDHINGNQFYNLNNAPHQVEFNYIGTNALTLNGTSGFNAFLVAPKVHVEVNGNFNYYGGIKALSLGISGNARVNYDESGGAVPALSDINFTLKKASQRYR